jgi:Fe-S oxidoreductase
VVLFGDCFTAYNESHIGHAAASLLSALGYEVRVIDAGCCGRSMISVGMLEQAIGSIDASVAKLRGAAADPNVRAIVVCEPSCLSAIKDDWLALKCTTPRTEREQIAAKAMLVEDFVERNWESHPGWVKLTRPAATLAGPPALLHGHCHQRSLWGTDTSARLLRRLVGDRLKVLDTGCCGMAGSFGFGRGRYDLSMKIGELTLFPAVRAAEGAVILAPGTSCRHQIHDGTGRRALHPIEYATELVLGLQTDLR